MVPPTASVVSAAHDSHLGYSKIECHSAPFTPHSRPSSSLSLSAAATSFASPSAAAGYTASVSTFEELVQTVKAVLGPSSGLDSSDVDVESLMALMRTYDPMVSSEQWQRYALAEPSRAYTRNGVDECNAKANLLILVWNPQKGSMIHDHANAHCIVKMLQGSLVETLYEWPVEASTVKEATASPQTMTVKRETTLRAGDVAYMSDTIGLHRMSNPSATELAVSLHLYTPPYAAKFGCLIFEESSGKKHHVKMSNLYSDKGVIIQNGVANTC